MTELSLEGLLYRAADPAAALRSFEALGARLVEPVRDHGFMLAGRAEAGGLALEVARFGAEPGAPEPAALLLAVRSADDLLATAEALGVAASAPLHTAITGPDGRPLAWWSVALSGCFDGEPWFPTGVGRLGSALIQTLLGTGRGRRAFAARARGPVVLLRAHETRAPAEGRGGEVRAGVPIGRLDVWDRLAHRLDPRGPRLTVAAGTFDLSWSLGDVGSGRGT